MINGSAEYATASSFRTALSDRMKQETAARGRSLVDLRREFCIQRFLALVFTAAPGEWMLKGGASLLMRLQSARTSRDVDLARSGGVSADAAVAELRALVRPAASDWVRFEIGDRVRTSTATSVVTLTVDCTIGGRRFDSFPIDLATELEIVARPERIRPAPVVAVPGMGELPEIVVYPLADQVADKICAMYELHGDRKRASTRYRDLVDLTLIVRECQLDSASVTEALQAEAWRRRTRLELPAEMVLPHAGWTVGYRTEARDRSPLPRELHSVEAALELVGSCLNPLLAGEQCGRLWDPATGQWRD